MKNKKSDKCTVLVCSCDDYEDLWLPFFSLFNIYWHDCPYEVVLNTESKNYYHDGLDIVCYNLYKEGDCISYGERMIDHLKRIKTRYVFVTVDDYFIQRDVNNEEIERVIDWMERDSSIACFQFAPTRDRFNTIDERFPDYELRPRYGEYKYALQAGIWRTDAFLKTWRKGISPWDWEIWGNYRSMNDGLKYYSIRENVEPPIYYGFDYDKGGAMIVRRGKWIHGDYERILENHSISVDYEKRGWYSNEIMPGQNDPFFKKERTRIMSTGLCIYLRIFAWRIIKYIKMKMHKKVNKTYMDYKRKEEKVIMDNGMF